MIADSLLAAKTTFLVTPLGYWKNKRIDKEKSKEINNALGGSYHITEEMNKKWSHLLSFVNFREETTHIIDEGNEFNSNSNQWIDKLVEEHYEIDKICYATDGINATLKLQKCTNTQWSSLSPDSKADISNLC